MINTAASRTARTARRSIAAVVPGPSPQCITIRYNKLGSCSIPLREQVGAELRTATAYVTSLITVHVCSRHSSDGILTALRAGRSNNRGSTLGRNKRCTCCKGPDRLQDPPCLTFNLYRRLSPRANRPAREADLSPHSHARIKKEWTYISTLPTPIPSGCSQGPICLSSLFICHGAELVLES